MKNFARVGIISGIIICAATCSGAGELPFRVGADLLGFNTPFVSVKICEPNSTKCRIVDRIKLDTGSDGLRISRTALEGLHLPEVKSLSGGTVGLCAKMAGGTGYLGPVAKADVTLGTDVASNSNLQIVDPAFGNHIKGCNSFPSDGRNGILGVSAVRSTPNGKQYYSCTANFCAFYTPEKSESVANMISALDGHYNGFVISMGNIGGARNTLSGKVSFGIGSPRKRPRAKCTSGENDFLKAEYDGKEFLSKFDTGSFSYLLPLSQTDFPRCSKDYGYLCGTGTVDIKILNRDGSVCANVSLKPHSYDTGKETITDKNFVLPFLTTVDDHAGEMLNMGMPFFFGRSVYFVFDGSVSSLGTGPLVAF